MILWSLRLDLTRKILNKTPTGTATYFGGEDLDYVNQLWTGTNQGTTDPVNMATTWTFRSAKLQIAGSSDISKKYSIAGSAITANRNVTIPTVGADRTFVTASAVEELTSKTIITSPSASDTNIYPDAFVLPNLGKKKQTVHMAQVYGTNFGFGFGNITGSGTAVSQPNAAGIGKYTQFTTATAQGSLAGNRSSNDALGVCRAFRPRYFCKVRFPSLTSVRFYFGLRVGIAGFHTGTDPLTAGIEGFMVGFRDTDSTFQVMKNDNSGNTTFANTAVSVAANTVYNIEIRVPPSPAASDRFQVSINGSSFASNEHTTDIPAAGTAIQPQFVIEQNEAAAVAKIAHLFYWVLEIVDP